MTTNEAHAALRSALLTLIQIIELPLVAGVSLMAIFTERLEPRYLQYGLALLLVPMLLRLAVAGRVVAPTLTLWPLLLLVALGGLSIYVTPAWVYTWPELVRLLAGVALALAVINWLNPITIGRSTPNQRVGAGRIIVATVVFLTLCGGLTVVGLLAMQATHKFLPALPWDGVARIKALTTTGTFNPNRVAGVAVLATPLVCALLLGSLRSDRPTVAGWLGWLVAKVAALLLSVGFGGALLLTESRGALLAAACALLALLPLLGRRGWLILLMVAVVGVALLSEVQPGDLDRFVIRDRRATAAQASSDSAWATILQDRNLQGRLILWRRALHGMADAPLTGMGLGAFEAVSQEPYPQVAGFVPDPDMSHVHNILLQVGLDLGLPGLLSFVALLAMIAFLLLRLLRHSRHVAPLHTWGVGLCGSFVAYLLYNMLDALTLGSRPALAVWCFFGLCIGAGERRRTPVVAPRRVAVHRRPQPVAPIPAQPPRPVAEASNWEERAWAITAGDQQR
ncbi:MAG: O-antigen ligase family protein [Caldilineaceae bacterium]